jgi:hypothetical protein
LLTDKASVPKAIFFSYGHDDNRELVEKFQRDLERRGHKVWIDFKDIGTWEDWRGKITEGIMRSDMAIAFLSAHSTRDPGVCRSEIAMALHRFGTVFPILLEPASRVSVPITISYLQWPDMSDWKLIRAGKVPGVDWKRWYEDKLIEIISRIEGERARFAHEVELLRTLLRPASFESKIAEHVGRFVGREWLFKDFTTWLADRPQSRIFWVEAGPGFGKTAVAANLSYWNRSAIVATWFCDSSSADLSNAAQALRSISFQMALRWDDYRIRLLGQAGLTESSSAVEVTNARSEINRLSVTDLFRRLLAEPISGLIWREQKLLILVDALDEATDAAGNNDLVELISQQFTGLPPWISFVVTSRPEPEVIGWLQGYRPFRIEAADSRNKADIKLYCEQNLSNVPEIKTLLKREQRLLFERIVQNSDGLILYIKMIEEGLAEQSLRLENLEGLGFGLQGLHRRYYISFTHRYGDKYPKEVRPLLRLVMAALGPLPADLARVALDVDAETFLARRNGIGSYLVNAADGLQFFTTRFGSGSDLTSAGLTTSTAAWDALGLRRFYGMISRRGVIGRGHVPSSGVASRAAIDGFRYGLGC